MPRTASRRSVQTRHDRSEFVTGCGMVQMCEGLPEPVQDWLIDAIPEGATLTDMLRAIVIDAYNEETQA